MVSNTLKLGLAALLSLQALSTTQAEVFKTEAGFVASVSHTHGFEAKKLRTWLGQAKLKKSIIKAMNRPSEAKPWHQYRKLFLTERRIRQGAAFMKTHQKALAAAEQSYGVPAEIIAAIIGVETSYGRNIGSFRVWDALYTLAFHFPRRAKFFQKELIEFLQLCHEQGFDISYPKGSYAGAMGIGQFMPSSYRNYAVDGDGDNKINLWQVNDAIASVAHYLQQHGWKRGEPILHAIPTPASTEQAEALIALGLKPKLSIAELKTQGLISPAVDDAVIASVMELKTELGTAYWLARDNFYSITRYNHSRRYAMAVKQLGDALVHRLRSTP